MADKLAYSLAEAANACGVSQVLIKKAIHAGDLAAKRTSDSPKASYLITTKALEKWLESLTDAA